MREDPFSLLRHRVADEYPEVFANDAAWALWCRLLIFSDQAYPNSVSLPVGTKRAAVEMLVRHELITELGGGRVRIRGIDKERERRSALGRKAATARWDAQAKRTHSGRNADALRKQSGSNADPMRVGEGEGGKGKERATTSSKGSAPPIPPRPGNGSQEPLLTKAQHEAWASFTAPEWQPFKAAWLARGFRHPPFGSDGDDDTSQRGLLWQIADARPRSLADWVRAAPGRTSREVIAYVLDRWHEVRVIDGDDPDPVEEPRSPAAAARLGDIVASMGGAK